MPEGDISVEVENVVGLMYQAHKIVLGLADCPEGPEYRDFERQAGIETEIRGKPGESCHNFGLAVDLGFHELRWIAIKSWSGTKYVKPNEKRIVTDTWWLHGLADYAPDQAEYSGTNVTTLLRSYMRILSRQSGYIYRIFGLILRACARASLIY